MAGSNSQVARFREQQAIEEQAALLGLSGFATTARHDFITARMERGGQRILCLIEAGRHDEALALMNTEDWGEAETDLGRPTSKEQGEL